MKMNGIMHINAAMLPIRLQAPAMPSFSNIGVVARGRTVARRLRVKLDAAFAEAA